MLAILIVSVLWKIVKAVLIGSAVSMVIVFIYWLYRDKGTSFSNKLKDMTQEEKRAYFEEWKRDRNHIKEQRGKEKEDDSWVIFS